MNNCEWGTWNEETGEVDYLCTQPVQVTLRRRDNWGGDRHLCVKHEGFARQLGWEGPPA